MRSRHGRGVVGYDRDRVPFGGKAVLIVRHPTSMSHHISISDIYLIRTVVKWCAALRSRATTRLQPESACLASRTVHPGQRVLDMGGLGSRGRRSS